MMSFLKQLLRFETSTLHTQSIELSDEEILLLKNPQAKAIFIAKIINKLQKSDPLSRALMAGLEGDPNIYFRFFIRFKDNDRSFIGLSKANISNAFININLYGIEHPIVREDILLESGLGSLHYAVPYTYWNLTQEDIHFGDVNAYMLAYYLPGSYNDRSKVVTPEMNLRKNLIGVLEIIYPLETNY